MYYVYIFRHIWYVLYKHVKLYKISSNLGYFDSVRFLKVKFIVYFANTM